MRLSLLISAVLLLAACVPDKEVPNAKLTCAADTDCPDGLTCANGLCCQPGTSCGGTGGQNGGHDGPGTHDAAIQADSGPSSGDVDMVRPADDALDGNADAPAPVPDLQTPDATPDASGSAEGGAMAPSPDATDTSPVVSCEQRTCTAATSDGCCPAGCGPTTDVDCPGCGNGSKDEGEACDPPATCPQKAGDCQQTLCTKARLTGSAAACTAQCVWDPITECAAGDNCCAPGCTVANDSECSAVCGNGVEEPGEACDPPAECARRQSACVDDADTIRTGSGKVDSCTYACTSTPRTCANADGQCPKACKPPQDNDCVGCGNNKEEGLETCDPPAVCMALSDACVGNATTVRERKGDPGTCTFVCEEHARGCMSGDTYCPAGCTYALDDDCKKPGGTVCVSGGECQSTMCADGACCTQSCTTCQSCKGAGGTCVSIAEGIEDNEPTGNCSGTRACDGGGHCLLKAGQSCGTDGNRCLSGICRDTVCCAGTCAGYCQACNAGGMAGTCVSVKNAEDDSCTDNSTCDAGGVCKRKDGISCAAGDQCASATCTTFYRDLDGDGFGNPADTLKVCGPSAPPGYVANALDCCDVPGDGAGVNPNAAFHASQKPGTCGGGWDWSCSSGTIETDFTQNELPCKQVAPPPCGQSYEVWFYVVDLHDCFNQPSATLSCR